MLNIKLSRACVAFLLLTALSLQLINPAFATGYLADPMSIGVGARSMGMGKAYVGMAKDGDAIFTNPAGIAGISSAKLSSMYTNLLGDVNYTILGGAFPYGERSAIGIGLVSSRVADITLRDDTGAITGSNLTWGSNVLFLSYGTYLSELPLNLNMGKDIAIGANLKYFNVGGSGIDGSGSGFDADLSALYPANEYATLGVTLQNALPASIGAKITKSGNDYDSIPSTLKVGAKVALMDKEGKGLFTNSSRRLYTNVDYDYYPTRTSVPGALHAGVEFWPTDNLALRAGSDASDMTLGVGVRVSGVAFDYAYHPYSGITENTSHYFSVSYVGDPTKRTLQLSVDSPSDKAVIYDDNVKVSGKVNFTEGEVGAAIKDVTVKVNGINAQVMPDGSFTANAPVNKYGKKLIAIEAATPAGDSAGKELRLVRLTSFADVPEGYWAKMPIENNATVGLVQGYPDGNFKPNNALTRAELATLLVRAKGIELPASRARQVFKDVKPDFWAAKYIEVAQREGLIKGYPDKSFRPNNKISKAEGIAVLVRFDKLALVEVDSKPYWDVSLHHWAARHIQAAKDAGMLNFVSNNKLGPKQVLIRSQAVDMLGKTSLASGKIKDLYTWEKGFQKEFTPEDRPKIRASVY
ncbi:MAG: PorV/PorQ family protein [Candidatus Margulisiibacteriota bacterium]